MLRFTFAALFLALPACDAAEPVTARAYPDTHPEDPFAFGCDLPPVDLADLTPQSCAITLATCADATIGQCEDADPKDCKAKLDLCVAHVETACWSRLPG